MSKNFKIFCLSVFCSIMILTQLSFAGTWQQENGKWVYIDENGVRAKSAWVKDSATSYWYYIGADGYMLTDAWTPDGYYVDSSGRYADNSKQTQTSNNSNDDEDTELYGYKSGGNLFSDLLDELNNGKFYGQAYNLSSAKSFSNIKSQSWYKDLDDEIWKASSEKVTSPTLFKDGSKYYIVTRSMSDKLTYTDKNDNEKTVNYYGIEDGDFISDEFVLIKEGNVYNAYYMNEDGSRSAVIKDGNGNTVEFDSNKTIIKYSKSNKSSSTSKNTSEEDSDEGSLDDFGLDLYEKDDFGKTLGVFTNGSYLCDGYWLLDKDGRYSLYIATAKGKSTIKKSDLTEKKMIEYLNSLSNVSAADIVDPEKKSNSKTSNTNTNTTNSNSEKIKELEKEIKELETMLNALKIKLDKLK